MRILQKIKILITSQGRFAAPGGVLFQRFFSLLILMVSVGLFGCLTLQAHAQVTDALLVQPPDIDDFPTIAVQFKLQAANGQPEVSLQPEQLRLTENNQVVPVLSLFRNHKGVHFTLAINGGRDLDLRDASGLSPFHKLTSNLVDWAEGRSFADADTWSLVTNEGFEVRNTSLPADWTSALVAYQPNFRTMTSSLASLESAIQSAHDRVVPFGVDKVLLYITVPPKPEQIGSVNALAEAAHTAGIHINVWMVGDSYYLSNDQGKALIAMASLTGGQFFHFTSVEAIPDPEGYLSNLGSSYTLTYTSRIQEPGTYLVRIQAILPGGVLSGESDPFFIDVQPPKPILISPPVTITRQADPVSIDPQDLLEPKKIDINIMVTFPDGYPREIIASRLYVDGRVVDVRSAMPFDRLTWDLAALIEPGEHTIQVEVEDLLGLSARTILTPVQIGIVLPESENTETSQEVWLTVIGGVAIAALVLLIAWLARRFWVGPHLKRLKQRLFGLGKDAEVKRQSVREPVEMIHATLIPLYCFDLDKAEGTIQTAQSLVTIGSDPAQAGQVLDEPGVDSLHAQLCWQAGSFWLNDLGSQNGTWINYDQIGTEPVRVQPGDLIHFGNTGFRFTIMDSEAPQPAIIVKYEPIL